MSALPEASMNITNYPGEICEISWDRDNINSD